MESLLVPTVYGPAPYWTHKDTRPLTPKLKHLRAQNTTTQQATLQQIFICRGSCLHLCQLYQLASSSVLMSFRDFSLSQAPQNEQDTHIDERGLIQPNPPVVNMLKIVNHIGTISGTQEKHLKFPIDVDVRGPYKHHLVVRVDTGADVNCMNEKTFRKLFPKVKLDVCPYEIQNFGNSTADISILGQFYTYLQFRGKKYLNTFIDCPNLLSHGATFRMGVLLPNYPEENVVKGDKVPNFKIGTPTSTSNVFQILQDLQLKQYQGNSEPRAY